MKDIHWSQLKSERLKKTRGVSFAVKGHPKRLDQNIIRKFTKLYRKGKLK